VRNAGNQSGFTLQAFAHALVGGIDREDLQRDHAIEVDLIRAVDDAGPAVPHDLEQSIAISDDAATAYRRWDFGKRVGSPRNGIGFSIVDHHRLQG
jgi:hypothetical protein